MTTYCDLSLISNLDCRICGETTIISKTQPIAVIPMTKIFAVNSLTNIRVSLISVQLQKNNYTFLISEGISDCSKCKSMYVG